MASSVKVHSEACISVALGHTVASREHDRAPVPAARLEKAELTDRSTRKLRKRSEERNWAGQVEVYDLASGGRSAEADRAGRWQGHTCLPPRAQEGSWPPSTTLSPVPGTQGTRYPSFERMKACTYKGRSAI